MGIPILKLKHTIDMVSEDYDDIRELSIEKGLLKQTMC